MNSGARSPNLTVLVRDCNWESVSTAPISSSGRPAVSAGHPLGRLETTYRPMRWC